MEQAINDAVTRINNALDAVLGQIEAKGFTREEAKLIFSTWRRLKVVKKTSGAIGSSWSVTHGEFFETYALRNALRAARPKARR